MMILMTRVNLTKSCSGVLGQSHGLLSRARSMSTKGFRVDSAGGDTFHEWGDMETVEAVSGF